MAKIERKDPITDADVDQIIKANEVEDPNSPNTQGVSLRRLVKALRDRLETEIVNTNEDIANKVDKVAGLGLSELSFTQADKTAIDNFNILVDGVATEAYVDEKVKAVYKVKPAVPSYRDLNLLVGSEEGDVRNVNETGDNYVWTSESGWDKIGGRNQRKLLVQLPSSSFSSSGSGWQNLENGTTGNDWSYTIPAGTLGTYEGTLDIKYDASAYVKVTDSGRVFGIRMRISQGANNKVFNAIYMDGHDFYSATRIMLDCSWKIIYRGSGVGWITSKCLKSGEDGRLHNYFNSPGEGIGGDIDLTGEFTIDFQTYNLDSDDADYGGWISIEQANGRPL